MTDDPDKREHFIGMTMAEITVVATALMKHQTQTDNFIGYRGATRFHDSALAKIKAYCDQAQDPNWCPDCKTNVCNRGLAGRCGYQAGAELQVARLVELWREVEKTPLINTAGSTIDWMRAYRAFEQHMRALAKVGQQ